MAAYGGYVAAQPADLSGIISNFGNKAIAIQEAAKEREDKKTLLEKQKEEKIAARDEERAYQEQQDVIRGAEQSTIAGIKEVSDPTAATGQQTYEGLATGVTSGVADSIFKIGEGIKSKQINPLQGKVAQQKLIKSYKDFVSGKENFSKGMAFIKQQAPKQSEIGKALGATYFSMGDMPFKTFQVTPNQDLVIYDMDPVTLQPVQDSAIPASTYANYQSFSDEEVDYNKLLDGFNVATRTAFESSGPLSQKKITSESNNKDYIAAKDAFISQTIPSDMDVARFLTQVDGYGIKIQGKQVKKPSKQGDKENPTIKFEITPAGIYVPIVTDEMKDRARKSLSEGIDARAKESQQVSRNPNIIVNTGGAKENKPTETEQQRNAADRLATAITNDIQSGSINSSNIKNFVLGLASDYDVDPRKSKLIDLGNGTKGIQIIATNGKPNVNFGQNGIVSAYEDIVSYVPKSQINRVLISDQKKRGTRAPKETNPAEVKIVTLEMVKQKLPEGATKDQINAYVKQLESTGKYKLKKP
jgi:hypothetical protein